MDRLIRAISRLRENCPIRETEQRLGYLKALLDVSGIIRQLAQEDLEASLYAEHNGRKINGQP